MLKILRLRQKLRELESNIVSREGALTDLNKRAAELEAALNEATTDDDIETVNRELNELPSDADIEKQRNELSGWQAEAESIRKQIEEIEKRAETAQRGAGNVGNHNGVEIVTREMTRTMVRDGSYYQRSDVKDFYKSLMNIRAVTGGSLTIPNVVVNRIKDKMSDWGKLLALVDVINVSGTSRIIISTDTGSATWSEQGSIAGVSDAGDISGIDLDAYVLSKITKVPNFMLKDSIISLDDFVTKQIAKAMTKALETAILKGEGSSKKQPAGIIPALESKHKTTANAGSSLLESTIAQIGLVDDGSGDTISIVMNRKTYYDKYAPLTIRTNSDGNIVGVVPNMTEPDMFGIPVVFSNAMDDDKILIGVFNEYALVVREGMIVESSEHAAFMEDQTAFRGKGRYDGKPKNNNAFVLVTINPA